MEQAISLERVHEQELSIGHGSEVGSPELAIIIPTFREAQNIAPLLAAIRARLGDAAAPASGWPVRYEIVFVDDDSPDGTARIVRDFGRHDPRIRCIRRIGRRGLASAVVEGILSTGAEYVAVMDADLQHDESLIGDMLQVLRSDRADVVVASRYVAGGDIGEWSSSRAWMSRLATRLSKLILPQQLSDPMSGFFMTRRDLFEEAVPGLSSEGYKILLDYLASSPRRLRCSELPFTFRQRLHGESKLDSLVLWEYAMLLCDKLVGGVIPPRFLFFGLVGGTGVLSHFVTLSLLHRGLGASFDVAQAVATLVAMTSNFALNNLLTYRDVRLTGSRWWIGLASFCAVCGIGAVANVGIASVLFQQEFSWWLSGLGGILVGTVFNFAMTSIFTWKRRR